MWQKQLKQIKKSLPATTKLANSNIDKGLAKETIVEKDINFAKYCQDLQINQLKQDTANQNLLKPNKNKYVQQGHITNNELEYSFEFMDINDAPKEFYRFGQRLLPKQLREYKSKVDEIIDTHHMTRAHAINLIESILDSAPSGAVIKIIHGIGTHSEYNQPVLLGTIRKFLMLSSRVLAFSYGEIAQGGNGITLVKLVK